MGIGHHAAALQQLCARADGGEGRQLHLCRGARTKVPRTHDKDLDCLCLPKPLRPAQVVVVIDDAGVAEDPLCTRDVHGGLRWSPPEHVAVVRCHPCLQRVRWGES